MDKEVNLEMEEENEEDEEDDQSPLPGPDMRSASYYHKPITFIRPVKQAAKKFANVLQPLPGGIRLKYGILVEVKNQNQWDELMLKEGLIVVDAYSAWCGPCKAIVSSLKRLKNEIGDDLLHFATAETDNIDSLEKYRMKSQPTFLFYAADQLRHVVRGCNCPLLMKCIKQQLEKEHKAIEQGLEREMFIDKEVETAVEPEIEEKKDEEKEIDEEEEEIAERMTRARSKHSGQVLSKGVTVPGSMQLEKQTTVAIIKPDAVKAGYVDDIIQKLEESGWEILKKEERTLSKEEAVEFYKQHEGTDHFEQLVEFMTSGPCMTLVLSKAGETLDTAHENVILEFRDLIGPKDVNVAKEEAPESLRAKYGTDSLMNAIHGCDSSESAARELAFFFPDFAAPTVVGKRKKKRLQRTLALIRPHALRDRKESILAKIEEAGFTIAMSKEIVLTKEQAEDFYAEHKDEDFFDTLVSNMTSGPMLALCLAREDAVEGWRELLGPKDVKAAQEEAPESSDEGLTEKPLPSLRVQFHVEDSQVNSLHGSDSMEAAHKELQKMFPMQSTVAVIKPETEPEQREAIIQRIKEAGFKISLQKEVTLTKELAKQFYHEHEGKEFFSGLTDYMTSGTTQFLVLSREDAVSGWRALMGPTDPGEAKEHAPQSLRAQFGVDKMKNVVHGSSNTDTAGEVIKTFFPEAEVLPDGTVKVPEPEKPKEEEKDKPTGQPDEDKYSEALGVGSGSIPDGNLSASSALDETCGAARGRLNIAADGEQKAAWCAQENDENQWIQVDCGKVVRLTKIETQGRGDDDSQRVTSYCVLYSNNGQDFTPYKENAEIKVFDGNSDQETVVCNKLATPVFTQYVRIQPKTWNEHIAMRLELHGFDAETFSEALGVGSGSIPDGNLSASSALDETCGAARGRLSIATDGEQKAAWCAQENDENQWIQVDCGRMVLVTRVAVQGRGDDANWVTSYTLSYSHNGEEFLMYEENGEAKVFEGNTDQKTVVYQWLSLPVVARYFRLNPKTWNGHIALRMELYGRQPEPEPVKSEQIEAEVVAQAAAPEREKSATAEEAGKADEETKPVEVSITEGEAGAEGSKSEAEGKPEGGEQEGEKGTEGDAAKTDSDDTKPEGGEGGVEATPQEGDSGDTKPQEGESGDASSESTKPSEEVKEEESKPEGSTAEEKDVENKGEESESKEDSNAEQPAAGDDSKPPTDQNADADAGAGAGTGAAPSSEESKPTDGEGSKG